MFYKSYMLHVCDLFPHRQMYHIFNISSYILEAVLCPRGWGEFLWNQLTELIKKPKDFGRGHSRTLLGRRIWQIFLCVLIYVRIFWTIQNNMNKIIHGNACISLQHSYFFYCGLYKKLSLKGFFWVYACATCQFFKVSILFFLSELQLQLNVMDKKLTQKNEEMNILLNYKVSQKGGNGSEFSFSWQSTSQEMWIFSLYKV